MSQQKFYAYKDGELKIFLHNGLIKCNGKLAAVYTDGGRMQTIVPRRCCWCGSRYKYMVSLQHNLQNYCPACRPIRRKIMLELAFFQQGRHKTRYAKTKNRKDRIEYDHTYNQTWRANNKEHRKNYQVEWKKKNKESEKQKRKENWAKKTPEQKAEFYKKRLEHNHKVSRHKRALESIQESTS